MLKPCHVLSLYSRLVLSSLLIACVCASFVPVKARAASLDDEEETIDLHSVQIVRYKVDKNFRVRGWKLSPEVYFGNAKVNGEWGLGLLVDKGDFVYGLNNTQASFMWRF